MILPTAREQRGQTTWREAPVWRHQSTRSKRKSPTYRRSFRGPDTPTRAQTTIVIKRFTSIDSHSTAITTEHVDPGRGRVRGHLSPLKAPLHPKTSHLADATTLFPLRRKGGSGGKPRQNDLLA